MDNYFENYVGSQNKNDMNQRAYNYSRILKCLSQINIMETYVVDGRNFIDIEDICKVEYRIESNNTEILIREIFFYQDGNINDDKKPILYFLDRTY